MKVVVDISDARFSQDPADELITYSLGSCIGVTMYDPQVHAAGMLHYQLPSAEHDRDQEPRNPMM